MSPRLERLQADWRRSKQKRKRCTALPFLFLSVPRIKTAGREGFAAGRESIRRVPDYMLGFELGVKVNFCPLIEAPAINPPLGRM